MTRSTTHPRLRQPSGLSLLAGLLALAVGCAAPGIQAPDGRSLPSQAVSDEAQSLYADPASAAIAALQHLRSSMRPAEQRRLHVGSIVRIDEGYAWRPAVRALDANRPIVRLTVDRRHVATYIVHPKTGEYALDRANSVITEAERRLVDEADPLHRPIFVLAPNGRMLGYAHRGRVVTLADLRRDRTRREAARIVEFVASHESTPN